MKKFMLLLIAGSLLGLAACGGDDGGDQTGTAQVRFVNTVFDASSGVEVLVDGTSGGTIAYGQTLAYSTFPEGAHTIAIRNPATGADFITFGTSLAKDASYTFVASGAVADGSGALFTDDNAAPSTGNFKVRVINASKIAGGGSFDVFLTPPGTDIFTVPPSISGLSYRNASTYVSNAAGSYQIRLTRAGTTQGQFFDGGTTAYTAGQIRTIVISNRSNNVVHSITLNDTN